MVGAHAAVQAWASNHFGSVLVVFRLYSTAPVSDITHIAEYKDREGRHALPLFLAKRIVEWLPRIGESIQIGRSLSQCLRASLQKGDGITIAHEVRTALVCPYTHCFLDFCNTGFPILRIGTNSALYRRPKLFLLRCQLQRGLYQINPHVRECIQFGCIQPFRSCRRRGLRGLRIGNRGGRKEECSCSDHYCFQHR
jgi:hypothetical protein